ncbi:MAG: DUF433 domain-containing protein [Candidatus Nanohalobium sp.]
MVDVVVDDDVRHGKPVIEGTRVTVEEVLGMLEAGMDFDDIESEYGVEREGVQAAVRYASSFMKGEKTGSLA